MQYLQHEPCCPLNLNTPVANIEKATENAFNIMMDKTYIEISALSTVGFCFLTQDWWFYKLIHVIKNHFNQVKYTT